jgi:hypothetical protein
VVEEALSAALIRKCNECSQSFLKDDCCNKITCSCGNQQCYLCGENVSDYTHFYREQGGPACPLFGESPIQTKAMNARAAGVLRKGGLLSGEDVTVKEILIGQGFDADAIAALGRETQL